MTEVDWVQVAGFMVTLVLFIGVVFGGWAYYNSERRKVHTDESDKLADTRGKRIEDLEDQVLRNEERHTKEMAAMSDKLQHQQGQIDLLRQMKTQEIIDGVVKDGVPQVIEGVLTGLTIEGTG